MSTTKQNTIDLHDYKLFGMKDFEHSFGDYNSAADKTCLPIGTLIRGSKNVIKKLSGTIASREGMKKRGTEDSTDAGVKASYEWETSVGTTRIIRVCNGKLQVESDIVTTNTFVWYNLLDTSTLAHPAASLTRFIFDTWWDNADKTDRLLMVRGDDQIRSWSGGMALIDSVTTTTITKKGTETWAQLGFAVTISGEKKIIINGAEYTYTGGEGTTTLTGVSGDPTSLVVANDVAIQSVIIEDNVPEADFKADIIKVIANQAWVASYSSRVVRISGNEDFRDFTNSGTLVSGDPDFLILDSIVKGIGVANDGKIGIFGGDADLYVITPNYDLNAVQTYTVPVVGGTGRNVIGRVEKKKLATLSSCLGQEFIDNDGNYLVWIDQKNQLRALGGFTNDFVQKPISLSLPVESELKEDDFTGGHLRVIGNTIRITAPNNARDWAYETREKVNSDGSISTERLWQPPQIRSIQRFAVIEGVLYGHSNVNPQIFQLENTNQWYDDGFIVSTAIEEVPYISVARFSYMQHGRRQGREFFDAIYFEGYMREGMQLDCNVYLDYQGSEGIRQVNIDADDDLANFFQNSIPPSLGDSALGDNPLGDGILLETNDQELIPKFRAVTRVPEVKNFFEYSLEVYSLEIDARWELICLGANVRMAVENANFLKK